MILYQQCFTNHFVSPNLTTKIPGSKCTSRTLKICFHILISTQYRCKFSSNEMYMHEVMDQRAPCHFTMNDCPDISRRFHCHFVFHRNIVHCGFGGSVDLEVAFVPFSRSEIIQTFSRLNQFLSSVRHIRPCSAVSYSF